MKTFLTGLALLVFAAAGSAQISVSANAMQLFGSTSYRFDALSASSSNPNDLYPIASELEFPLDTWLAGVNAELRFPGGKWALAASVAANLGDPSDKMTDDDWKRGRLIQHTESDAALTMITADAAVRRHVMNLGIVPLSAMVLVDYETISEDMTGYDGWYYSENLQREVPISGTEPSMAYDVSFLSPQAGLAVSFSLPGSLITLAAQSTAGVVFAWDTNDHLLRGKRAEGDATGFGTRTELAVSGSLFRIGMLPVTLGLRGEVRYFSADGTATQTWYRDEQTSDGLIRAGTSFSGLPHDFTSTQFGVGITAGVRF